MRRFPFRKASAALGAALLASAMALAWFKVEYLCIPYFHSFSRQQTRYLLVYRHWNGLPSQLARIQVDSAYPGGAFFGKVYNFPGGCRVETRDFGPLEGGRAPTIIH